MPTDARKSLADLARGVAGEGDPLFAPVIHGVGAQIEALAPAAMVVDATRLGKGLTETRRVLGLPALYVTVPSLAEAEALGAGVDLSTWPPRLTQPAGPSALEADESGAIASSPRLQAALELTRRLAATDGEAALLVGLTGPATLVQQLVPTAVGDQQEDAFDYAGGFLTALVRAFGEAGAHAVVLQETVGAPDDTDVRELWDDALAPVTNVAHFHKMPVLLGFVGASGPGAGDWPDQVVPCLAPAEAAAQAGDIHAVMLPADPSTWRGSAYGAAVIITAGEVPADTRIADLKAAIKALA
ncbi:hypothetical protein [Spectribacter hydrogenoxidans]|uniref:Uncharacterized protein n=1 Tax=Spectribacter hydrogenoxidans TaxID=3075608 RepID=A0ABU3C287_9GAMM|nr:hypothetical protein [Salinisphaera sp. W335]MDT0635671.1 hypothetical protein [Salinisphaera sp. W335]